MTRCRSTYPATLAGRPVRCELAAGHPERHSHSFAARYWDDPEPEPCRYHTMDGYPDGLPDDEWPMYCALPAHHAGPHQQRPRGNTP